MQRIKRIIQWLVVLTMAVSIFIVGPIHILWKFHHPEAWIPGSMHDPRIDLSAYAALALLCTWVAWRIVLMNRKKREMARLAAERAEAHSLYMERRRNALAAMLKRNEELLARLKGEDSEVP
jgi:hypothetical protein